ncbi:MAG: hypothetical protein KBA86_02745 [Bacteroidales bacterium]|jgi:hypothetical protein|nr:hypothetical protein [Bacteroidales bacterium]
MRIWSLHPKYLDTKGLIALWRETLLAKHVLQGKTKAYIHHPQLERFKQQQHPLNYINKYLLDVYEESIVRGFVFDKSKIGTILPTEKISLNKGQLEYEKNHLLFKLKLRDPNKYHVLTLLPEIETHPLFVLQEGDIENWEIIR